MAPQLPAHPRDMHVTRDRALATAHLSEVVDHLEVVDALYRFGLGQDLRDKDLFASAFAPNAELEFQPAASRWGGQSPPMVGRDTSVGTICTLLADRIDTTHTVTNPRVEIDGDTARLTAMVEAQHLLRTDHRTFALLKNLYSATLVRDGSRWLIHRLRIDNVWYTGEPGDIFAVHDG